jgi:hypothetical protein
MNRPRPNSPKKPSQAAGTPWWRSFQGCLVLPTPARLAFLCLVAVLVIGTLVLLIKLSAGGLNRLGIQQLAGASGSPDRASGPSTYLRR